MHSLDVDPKTRLSNLNDSQAAGDWPDYDSGGKVRVDSETNLRDILDKVHEIHIDDTHFFTLPQVYEDLLLKMGEKTPMAASFLRRAR